MPRKFEADDDGEVESCYLENGVYRPWSEIAAEIDAKWDRRELRDRLVSIAGGCALIAIISWALVALGIR